MRKDTHARSRTLVKWGDGVLPQEIPPLDDLPNLSVLRFAELLQIPFAQPKSSQERPFSLFGGEMLGSESAWQDRLTKLAQDVGAIDTHTSTKGPDRKSARGLVNISKKIENAFTINGKPDLRSIFLEMFAELKLNSANWFDSPPPLPLSSPQFFLHF